jgi:hypothetical protein
MTTVTVFSDVWKLYKNSNFSAYKDLLAHSHVHLFIYSFTAVFILQQQRGVVIIQTLWPMKLHLLSGPVHKKFADLSNINEHGLWLLIKLGSKPWL